MRVRRKRYLMPKIIAWVDVEANGTASEIDTLLEVALVLTNFNGDQLAEPYTSLVAIPNVGKVMEESQKFVKDMHEKSGLWDDLWKGNAKPAAIIDLELAAILAGLEPDTKIHFGGNSPTLDRRYAELYLPTFYRMISHQSVDVTTLSLVLQESNTAPMFRKRGQHRALPDVLDSIDEYCHYLRFIQD